MKNIFDQLVEQKKISYLKTPDYRTEAYYYEIEDYINLCYLDAENMRERADKNSQNGPSKQHSTSDFIVKGFLNSNNHAKHYEVENLDKRLKFKIIPDSPSSAYSRNKNRFNLLKIAGEDPFRLERLFAVMEGNAAIAIKYRRDNLLGWNPYEYPEDCFNEHGTRPNSSRFMNSSDKIRIAISAFFAIHYLRSQLTEVMFNREIKNNFGTSNGYGYHLTEDKYFSGKTFPEFIEFLLPFAIYTMSTRAIRWCHYPNHIILPEKNLITPISVDNKNILFLDEEGFYIPLGPKFAVMLTKLGKSHDYHDSIVYGTKSMADQALRKSIELFSYEILLNPNKKAKFLTHMDSDLTIDPMTNKLYSPTGSSINIDTPEEIINEELAKIENLMPLIPKQR